MKWFEKPDESEQKQGELVAEFKLLRENALEEWRGSNDHDLDKLNSLLTEELIEEIQMIDRVSQSSPTFNAEELKRQCESEIHELKNSYISMYQDKKAA